MRTGRFGAVRDLLQGFVGQHPGRERAWGQLMTARACGGDTAGAIATYRAARIALVEGFGVEPSGELTALYRSVLRREPGMTPPVESGTIRQPESAAPRERASVAGPAGPLRQLPADLPVLFGREAAVRGPLNALNDRPITAGRCRVAAVVGPAGVGKTALAIHLAHLLRPAGHGAHLFVDLGGPTPTGDAPRPPEASTVGGLDTATIRLLHACGVTGDRLPGLPADRHVAARLSRREPGAARPGRRGRPGADPSTVAGRRGVHDHRDQPAPAGRTDGCAPPRPRSTRPGRSRADVPHRLGAAAHTMALFRNLTIGLIPTRRPHPDQATPGTTPPRQTVPTRRIPTMIN
ncbi:AfsR/SARP family transcriptional regulator [Polymorphospora rubra]|uniref:AfsR/SARP family transcriptional regulator n=1 Tax=Polymorphospora rubra TaxID=338584 RepID=UPI0033F1C896